MSKTEWLTCAESPAYFCNKYCQIYTATGDTGGTWHPFTLWPAQVAVMQTLQRTLLTIVLKSRQMGLSWEVLAYALWKMLFHPIATVGLFSRREDEAIYLLGPERLRGMYARLPAWMQVRAVLSDNDKRWELSNGSVARAFPTSAGDSYVNTLAIADEFDLVEDQSRLVNAVKPTIDAGGQMVLVSRVDKRHPDTLFKRIYQGAAAGQNAWTPIFLPWYARPDRTPAWYAGVRADILANTGTLDDLHEQYPATDAEALAQPSGDKRIPPDWLLPCYERGTPLPGVGPGYAGLVVYALPVGGTDYVIGADPAEGNPQSDDSAAAVVDRRTGAEVATLVGKIEPEAFARQLKAVSDWYNAAPILPERNNHGGEVISHLPAARVLPGPDGRPGYQTNVASKPALYDKGVPLFRDGAVRVRSFETFTQLSSIDGNTLSAPVGQHDDRAMAFMLAQYGRTISLATPAPRQRNYMSEAA